VALVVDTDVVSYLYKRDTRAELYRAHLNDPPFIISFMSLAELRRWTLERNWGERRKRELEEYLSRYFVIHSEDQMCDRWAEAVYTARLSGHPIAASDAWIAATALFLDVPLVTHNDRHYSGVAGLQVISEGSRS
jgi:predicted nucleic acid-binding protein